MEDYPNSFSELLDDYWYKNCKYGYHTIKTGLTSLDEICKGWHAGELCLVGGRPAMGKTAFVLGVSANILRQNLSVALFSATDTLHPVFLNRIIKTLNENTVDFEDEDFTQSQFSLDAIPLFLYLKPKLTLEFIRIKAKELKQRCGLNVIFVETLQSIYESKHQGVEEVCYALKEIALETGIPVVVTCDVCKAISTNKWDFPNDSVLQDGDSIKDIADSIYLLNRPEYYKVYEDEDGNDLRGVIELFVIKKKYGGGGRCRLGIRRGSSASIYDFDNNENQEPDEQDPSAKELMDFLNKYYQEG